MESLGLGIILSFRDEASSRIAHVLGLLRELHQSIMQLGNANASGLIRSLDGIAKAATVVGSALTALGAISSNVFKDMIQDTVKLGMKFEQFLVGLEQLWGGKDIARKKFEEYESIAAQTPFTFEEIMPQAIRAKALGIDPSKKLEVEVNGQKYSRSFFDAMMDLYTIRPDKGKDSAGRGIVEYVEGQARPLKWMYGFNDKNMLAKIGEKPKADHEERLKDVIKMEAMRGMIGAWEKTEQMFSVVLDNIIGDLHYLAYFINQSGLFEQIKAPFLDFYKFLKSITQEEDKHTMKTLGKSISDAFGIIAAPAMGAINALFGFLKVLIQFTAEHPKIVSVGLAIAGLGSQIVLLGGILLLASAAFNFFRSRVMRGLNVIPFMRMLFINAVASMRMFVRSVFPVVAALGTLHYAFRNNLFGIRTILDSTTSYISNFMDILFDALTHYDVNTGFFSLSEEHANLAEEMGIIDFISAIVTAEGYVIRLWSGFKKGVAEAQATLDVMAKKITDFMYKIGLLEIKKNPVSSIADFRMQQEGRTPSSGVQAGEEGSYENPIKKNVLYNLVFDQNIEDVGAKIGNIALPLAILVGSLNLVKVAVSTVMPLISGLGTAFLFLGRAVLSIIPYTSRLSRLFNFAPYLRGMLQGLGGLILRFGSMFLRALPMIGQFAQILGYTFAGLLLRTRATLSLYASTISAFLSPILARVSQFAWSFARFLLTPVRFLLRAGAGVVTFFRAIGNAFSLGGLRGVANLFLNIGRYILTSLPLIGSFIGQLMNIRRVFGLLSVLRGLLLGLRFAMASNPIGLALLAIGLAVEFVINHWEQFQNTATDVWNHITTTLEQAWERIKAAFQPAINAMKSAWDSFTQAFPQAAEVIMGVFGAIIDTISVDASNAQAIFNAFGLAIKIAFDIIIAVVEIAADIIAGAIEIISTTLKGLIDFLTAVFTGEWEAAWEAVKSTVSGIAGAIIGIIGGISSAIGGLIDRLREAIGLQSKLGSGSVTVTPNASGGVTVGGAFAEGGIITRPEIALIGEAGREIIVPVTRRDERTKSLAFLAAKETGVLADIVNTAQVNNSPIGFEVRGMQPITNTSNNPISTAYSNTSNDNTTNVLDNSISNSYQRMDRSPAEIRNTFNPVVQGTINYIDIPETGERREVNNNGVNTSNYINYNQQRRLEVLTPEVMTISSGIQKLVSDSRIARNYYEIRQNIDRYNTDREFSSSYNKEILRGQNIINNQNSALQTYMRNLNATTTSKVGDTLNSSDLATSNQMEEINNSNNTSNITRIINNSTSSSSVIQEALNNPYITSVNNILAENERRYYSPLSEEYELRGESKWQRRQVTGLDALTTAINEGGLQGIINLYLSKGRSSYPNIIRDRIISTSRSNTPLPVTNVPMSGSLSGIPSEDKVFLEQMMSNPINPPRPISTTSNQTEVSSSNNKTSEINENESSSIITNTKENITNKSNVFDNVVTSWKSLQRNVGNFFGGIFGFRKPEETVINEEENVTKELAIEPDVINRTNILTENILPTQQKKGGFLETLVTGWKSLQRNVGNFIGGIFGFRQKTDEQSIEDSKTVSSFVSQENKELTSNSSVIQKNTESIVENPIRNINSNIRTNSTNVTRRPVENIGIITSNNENVVEELPQGEGIIQQRSNSILESRRDRTSSNLSSILSGNSTYLEEEISGGIIGKVKKTLREINSFLNFDKDEDNENVSNVDFSTSLVSGNNTPIQPVENRVGLPVSMPVQTFSQSIQLPTQQEGSIRNTPLGMGGERNITYHIDAIKLEIKSEMDVKKIVPLIKKELQRLQTTNQKGGLI